MREERSKNPLALMEQVIMILVFAMAAAICVKAFVTARNMSVQSVQRSHASSICQTAADVIKSTRGDIDSLCDYFDVCIEKEVLRAYYDDEWKMSDKAEASFCLCIIIDDKDECLGIATISMIGMDEEVIFEMETAWQKGGRNE